MKKYKGIIFDIDGTLVSTNKLIFATFNHIGKKFLKKEFSDDEIIALFGPTEEDIIDDLLHDISETAKAEYYKFYENQHDNLVTIYPEIKETISEIKKKNIKLAIYTGKGKRTSDITLKKIGLYDYFDFMVTGTDAIEEKPSAKALLSIVEKFNLKNTDVLMIGDAPPDVIAAKGAGVDIASVLWDSYARTEVLTMGSDYYFFEPSELKKFILNSI